MTNALIATRLSNFTDESTSIERQGEQGEATAKARGEDVVHVAQDVDVSGAVSPFQRADLGPWLTDPDKIAQWDMLIVAKLDRLSRSLIDFAGLLKWCQKHGKIIVSVSESLDFGTAAGRLMAQTLMMFAEFERERMSERRADAAVKLRSNAHYGGGTVPYGYRTVKGNSHWEREPDPAQVEQAMRVIEAQVVAGLPAASATRMLASLEIRRETLAALPQREAWAEWRDGGSFSDRWADLDADADRGALLRQMGVKVAASTEGRKVTVTVAAGQPVG